ncbi:hypothetical protein ACA910_002343 [Epithemia clementina (nom. ined.)]
MMASTLFLSPADNVHPDIVSALKPFLGRRHDYGKMTVPQARGNSRTTTLTIGNAGGACLRLDRPSLEFVSLVLFNKASAANFRKDHHVLTHIRLVNIAIEPNAGSILCQLFQNNPSLTTLTTWSSGNAREDEQVLICLSSGLAHNHTITRVKFYGYNFAAHSPPSFSRQSSTMKALGHLLKCKNDFCSIEFESCLFDPDPDANLGEPVPDDLSARQDFFQGLTSQVHLESFELYFCQIQDQMAAQILQQLAQRRCRQCSGDQQSSSSIITQRTRTPAATTTTTTTTTMTTASLRRLYLNHCTGIGRATFETLNELLRAQWREERQQQPPPQHCLQELRVRVAINDLREEAEGEEGNDWAKVWHHDYVHILRHENYSLERMFVEIHGIHHRPSCLYDNYLSLRKWQKHFDLLEQRNRAIRGVQRSLLVGPKEKSASNIHQPLPPDDQRFFVPTVNGNTTTTMPGRTDQDLYELALFGQVLIKLLAIPPAEKDQQLQQQPATTMNVPKSPPPLRQGTSSSSSEEGCSHFRSFRISPATVGLSAAYLALSSRWPQLRATINS